MTPKQSEFERRSELIASITKHAVHLWSHLDDLEEIELDLRRRIRRHNEQFFRRQAEQRRADERSRQESGEITWGNDDPDL